MKNKENEILEDIKPELHQLRKEEQTAIKKIVNIAVEVENSLNKLINIDGND